MRASRWIVLTLLLASCGQPQVRQESKDLTVMDVTEESSGDMAMRSPPAPPRAVQAPGISVTAAPGVAFNYAYAFRLPSPRISPMQEAHAQMCEKLGPARCRITGMRYRLANERDISAMLALKLDPAIAREFGKQATALVTRSEGMLVDQEISGFDAGSAISDANRSEARADDDLARVEAELRRPGLTSAGRERLLAEAADLRTRIRSLAAGRDADRESLARTPMVFNYGSGSLIPGFDTSSPLRDAWEEAAAMFVGALGLILRLLAAVIPFLLLAGLAWAAVRRFAPARLRSSGRHHGRDEAAEAAALNV